MRHTIICDIDGTIADLTHRLPCIHPPAGQRKDWDAFHAQVGGDTPHLDMRTILYLLLNPVAAVQELGHMRRVIYVSGRMEKSRAQTKTWMETHGFPWGQRYPASDLYMRRDGDFRSDDIVKEEIVDNLGITPADVLCVLDDRDRVVSMWRRRGFRCLQVASGNF